MSQERPLGLMVRCAWGQSRLGSTLLRDGDRPFTIGSGEGADFVCMDADRGVGRFVLAPDARTVRLTRRMTGTLWRGQQEFTLQQAIDTHQAEPDGDGYALTLGGDDALRLELGGVSFEAFRVRAPPRVAPATLESVDLRALNIFAATFFFAAAAVVAAMTISPEPDFDGDGLGATRTVAARLLVTPPPRQSSGSQAAAPAKKELVHARQAEPAGHPHPTPLAARQAGTEHDRLRQSLQGTFAGAEGVFGPSGLSGELSAAIGSMRGSLASVGLDGVGLRGGSDGGGGGDRIGFGGIGTHGRGGGQRDYGAGSGFGCQPGKTCKPDFGPTISIDPVTVCGDASGGCLDKELIRRVIRAHLSQIRYCYESQLTVHPSLHGKVAVRFAISQSGDVATSRVDSSTVGDSTLESCVASRVLTWHFPQSRGTAVVTYPFLFQRAGN